MSYLVDHWSYDPFMIVVIVLVAWHEIGLARLARRARPERARQRPRRAVPFSGGAPRLLPLLLDALPGRLGRSVTRTTMRDRWSAPVRAVAGFMLSPWVAVVFFSVVMIFWHIPVAFDLAERNQAVHIWLAHATFFIAGVLFWLQFIPSPPFRRRMPLLSQAAALIATNVVMWMLAMSMSIFTQVSWYSAYSHVPGVTLPPYADQQIGAAILWVCGDFWAIPALFLVLRRMINEDGGVGAAIDQILNRGPARAG